MMTILPILAELSNTEMAGAGAAVNAAIFTYFKIIMSREQKSRKALEVKVNTMGAIIDRSALFVSGVTAASQAGPTVRSSLIHDLYEQHRPSSQSGEFLPLPRTRKDS